ncbi:MAG: N-6 DNA methylase [Planctomycetota bacterium]|jgi:hypothetical protein|nr:N-6 DNA methylase [Planctomycetota bacterium]
MPHPLEAYLAEICAISSTGGSRKETSFYPPLAALINAAGAKLAPRVFCVSQVRDTGGGSPDFGLYTVDQRQKGKLLPGVPPERGVVEVKAVEDDAWRLAGGEQVTRYWGKYGQVLVTNYRDFLLVGRDEQGVWAKLESFRLAESAGDFWARAEHPRKTAAELGDRLLEYLKRALSSAAVLTEPENVAWLLASYARDAKARIDAQGDLPGLKILREGMEETLGMKFSGSAAAASRARREEAPASLGGTDPTSRGEHFFRATLVQTLFYGLFSSWVLWSRGNPAGRGSRFDWRAAAWNLHVPLIADLFSQLAQPGRLKPLGLEEVMDWTGAALNRVDRAAFFARFEEEHAIQYFYEPFLKAYDPELRKDLGVWYTPPEIVKYQVERVDAVLREELGLADGLADPGVFVLDPCCGTGAYLLETLRKIRETLDAKGAGAAAAARLKAAACGRVFGFEILPAPFVIAHLQLGLLLRRAGAPLDDAGKERAGVFLTNALTGWEPPGEPKTQLPFPEMEAERAAANKVKRDKPILVVLGNPPYNAFAGASPAEEAGLVDAYKEGLNTEWGVKKFNLDDLYVRFFRVAERRIVKSGRGVVSFVSNYSWSSEPSFVALRKKLSDNFDKIWIENLHGNRKISEYAPDGRTSETVFAIPGFSPGIQQGVVTSLWMRTGNERKKTATIYYRDDLHDARAVDRRSSLLASLKNKRFNQQYEKVVPAKADRYSFRPGKASKRYREWLALTDLCAVPPMNGLMEKRGGALIDMDRDALERRMKAYFDKKLDWSAYVQRGYGLTKHMARFDPPAARKAVMARENFDAKRIVRYYVRPYDVRWCYYTGARPIWNEPRPTLWAQCWEGNSFFVSRLRTPSANEGWPCFFVKGLSDDHFLMPDASCFPLRLKNGTRLRKRDGGLLFAALGDKPEEDEPVANLSPRARNYLSGLGIENPDADEKTAGLLWHHALAICCSPAYLAENADAVRADWPRIPLPTTAKALHSSAELGRAVAALLDGETPVPGVTAGKIRAELRLVGILHEDGGGQIDPNSGDLDLTAGWGRPGKDGVVMPGRGKVHERSPTPAERKAQGGAPPPDQSTLDIFLNDRVCWKNIPGATWNFAVGGYQVLKKWLSYRDRSLIDRSLTLDEAEYVASTARRLTALAGMGAELDRNYRETAN